MTPASDPDSSKLQRGLPGTRETVQPRKRSARLKLLLVAALVALAWYGTVCVRIARQQWRDETRPADVLVVFGAAEYAGKPSPVFRARLDHAYTLYERHMAPYVIVTGGYGGDPTFSEGGVGRDYLVKRGVPEDRVIAETQSPNTIASAERVANIMVRNGMHSCVAVSDPYHIFRIKGMLEHYGIDAYGSPRLEVRSLGQRLGSILREGLSYCLWRLHLT
jgi:uncharacterized SAM-binding protein YcdF (DUF218 family)